MGWAIPPTPEGAIVVTKTIRRLEYPGQKNDLALKMPVRSREQDWQDVRVKDVKARSHDFIRQVQTRVFFSKGNKSEGKEISARN